MTGRALFVGGGTGGHSIPLLAVMEAFQRVSPKTQCHYVGSAADLKLPSVAQSPLNFVRHAIATGKLNRYLTLRHIPEGVGLLKGLAQAYFLVRRLRPDFVFSKGGAASVPVVWAAARLGIPIYSHETDVAAGLANRYASRFAKTVFTAFPVSWYADLPGSRAHYVGQPVRAVFREADSKPLVIDGMAVPDDLPLIGVTGGSQGGRGLNNLVADAWSQLLESSRIIQVCGNADLESLRVRREALPERLRERLVIVPYLGEEFPRCIKRCDLLVVRAGGTVFELAAAAKPAVLVPLPTAAQDHQNRNAAALQAADAAVVVNQDTVGKDTFSRLVLDLLGDSKRRKRLAANLAQFDRPQAAEDMAQVLAA